jgi:hypothetical protein
MWQEVSAMGAACIQLRGNHDQRWRKRIAESLPEAAMFFNDDRFFDFPKVTTARNDRDPVPVKVAGEKVLLHHGWLSKLGDHCQHFDENALVGHSHKGGSVFQRRHDRVIFELNCGFMGMDKSYVFNYGAAPHKWTVGFGVVDHNGPRFIGL